MIETETPPPPTDVEDGEGDGNGGAFLTIKDVRETQPDERLDIDGVTDHPFMLWVGCPDGLTVLFNTGTKTPPETEGPFEMYVDREALAHVWPFLTHWVETGQWPTPPPPKLPPDPCPKERL